MGHRMAESTFPRRFGVSFSGLLVTLVVALNPACGGCGEQPAEGEGENEPGNGSLTCEGNADCPSGLCESGVCVEGNLPGQDGGVALGDGGGLAGGELTVQPGELVEFGAQLIGYPVTQDVILINSGAGPLKILAVLLDTETSEFTATPEGTLGETLDGGDNMVVQVTHTPADGSPDSAELKILHDGPGGITTVTLLADFKGDATFAATLDQDTIEPSVETVDFGEIDPASPLVQRLWLRNTGREDSVLEISDITLTPPTVGFTLVDEPTLPRSLGAWSAGLCVDGSTAGCPPGADACTDQVCVDDEGEPINALPIDIEYTSATLPVQATLTIEHNALGAVQQTDIALVGSPTQPDITLDPDAVDFGVALVGAPTAPEVVVTVTNDGPGPLLITKVTEPNEPAFSFDFSRPVPTIDGDPALRLDNGATPLDITVTFTPSAGEAYTAFLLIETNDGDELQINLPIQGVGLVCQDNAHVNLSTGMCQCDEGFISCGGVCKVPGATACGDACTDCTAVPGFGLGTAASCETGGTCAYTCEGGYYDHDDGNDGAPGDQSWNGCEYRCDVEPAFPSEYSCDGRDEDCNGVADDGLDPDFDDRTGNNNTRAQAVSISPIDFIDATAGNPAPVTLTGHSLYPEGDTDWFRVVATEGDGSLSCAEEIPCIEGGQENYLTTFEVVSPNGLDYDVQVWAPTYPNYSDPNGDGTMFNDSDGDNYIGLQWSRASNLATCVLCNLLDINCFDGGYGCAFDDSQVFFVNVRPQPGSQDTYSCENYELKVQSISLPPGS
jgi:hypothetical protein